MDNECHANICVFVQNNPDPSAPPPLLTKITSAQNYVALSYHQVRGLYFVAAIKMTLITK